MQLIAHRGASGHAPENTMAAFRLALKMGAEAIELDVHQTKDRELVVIHDPDFKRVSRRKLRVRDLTLKEIGDLDVGAWFDRRFTGEKVPLLEEVMDLVKGKAELHIELKNGSSLYPGIEQRLVELIQKRNAWPAVLVSSFDHEALKNVRALDARIRIGYLRGSASMKTSLREMDAMKAESLNMSLSQLNAKSVSETHQRGLRLLIYTVNTMKDVKRLEKMGVDGVFSNFPELKKFRAQGA